MENRYLLPGVVLVGIAFGLAMLAAKTNRDLKAKISDLEDEQSQVSALDGQIAGSKAALAVAKSSTKPADHFMELWREYLKPGKDGNAILADANRYAAENTVSVQGRKPGSPEYIWKGKPLHSQSADCTGVSSEYYRLVNWLGSLERAWPLARFESVQLAQAGPSLSMQLHVAYPSFLVDPKTP